MMKRLACAGLMMLTLAGCSEPEPITGKVVDVLYQSGDLGSGADWNAAIQTEDGQVHALTTGTGHAELAVKVKVGDCVTLPKGDLHIGNPDNIVVVRGGDC